MVNLRAGFEVIVYAGSLYDHSGRGVVIATGRDTAAPRGEFRTAAKEGALRIINAEGNLLSLISATGSQYTFDVDSMVLTPK